MRRLIGILFFALLCAVTAIQGQQQSHRNIQQYVFSPPENILLVVASQSDCPLLIENARLLINIDGKNPPLYQYRLRNRGAKPITSYTIAIWASSSTGWSRERTLNELLMPGQTFSPRDQDQIAKVIPLTDELRDKLKLGGPMKAVVVLMIENVRFTDGSAYNAQKTAQAMQDYFETINSEVINSKASP
jgi:hypothetical protein